MFTLGLTRGHRPFSQAPGEATSLGFLGVSEPILWAQSALWREKLEVQGLRGPATAVSEFSLNSHTF